MVSKKLTSGYNDAFMKANELADILEIEKKFKDLSWRIKSKRQFDYETLHGEQSDPGNIFKREFFYLLLGTALLVTEDRFEQMESHKSIWGFLYTFHKLPGKCSFLLSLHGSSSKILESQQSDFNGVDLTNKLIHRRQILSVEYKAPKEVLTYILDIESKEIFFKCVDRT